MTEMRSLALGIDGLPVSGRKGHIYLDQDSCLEYICVDPGPPAKWEVYGIRIKRQDGDPDISINSFPVEYE